MGNPSKDIPWLTIFDAYDIHNHDFDKEPFYITAKQIKTACQDFKKTAEKEVRILCYQAQKKDKPQVFNEKNLFLLLETIQCLLQLQECSQPEKSFSLA